MESNGTITLFVKNLSYKSDEDAIKKSVFGEVSSVRIVMDKEKNISRCSAFVTFKNKADGIKCLSKKKKKNSIIVDENTSIILDGMVLEVRVAIDRKEIPKIHNGFNRYTELLSVGDILPGSKEEENTPENDLRLREKIRNQNKKKIKDADCYVSRKKLSIQNIPFHVNDKDLKEMFKKAGEGHVQKAVVIVDRDKDRKSKGFGFVEFWKHESALKAIEKLNNNPKTFECGKRLIIGFSIEKGEVTKKRNTKSKNQKEMARVTKSLLKTETSSNKDTKSDVNKE
eukprot:GHVP01061181.1.p1 GENE.GHVP01061181.1~~GHVP01061181.1.p1  ORF type:complete len:284 (+),score=68.15 GHVP01061181.1:455-1306(+)